MKSSESTRDSPASAVSFPYACLVLLTAILVITVGVIGLELPTNVVMLLVFVGVVALTIPVGFRYAEVQEFAFETIKSALAPILILIAIGAMIGSWIAAGVVPTMISYGFAAITPAHFLLGTLVLCTIVSVATGTSWGTVGTVGIALVAVAEGLDIPVAMAAGSVVSGAYFGDKMSPLSDSTNLSSAVADTDLMVHIRHMLWTTVPAFLITAGIFALMDAANAGEGTSAPGVDRMVSDLAETFTITPVALLPMLLVIVLLVLRKPPFVAIVIGAIAAVPVTVFVQDDGLASALAVMQEGYLSDTGNETLDGLLTAGGMVSMGETVVLMILAVAVGGVLSRTGILGVMLERVVRSITTPRRLVASTWFVTLFANMVTASNTPAHVVGATMMKPEFNRLGVHRRNLSRVLEDTATITGPIIPWNTAAVYVAGVLGVATTEYLPFAFLCLTVPLISLLYAITGFTLGTTPGGGPGRHPGDGDDAKSARATGSSSPTGL